MASPLSAATFLAALKAEGVKVVEHDGWRTHNRNHIGAWGPVHGVMNHHTAGTDSLNLCIKGTADLPGPLCIGLIDKAGVVHLVGYGRTNHAGAGSRAVFEAVVAERALPATGPDEIDGNRHFYGFEIENRGDGKDPYPAAQANAVDRLNTAICRAHGWTAPSCIGHKEWTRRKIDPRTSPGGADLSPAAIRARVAERLKHSAGWSPAAPKPPVPAPAPAPTGPTAKELLTAVEKAHKSLGEQIAALRNKIGA